MRKDFKEDFKEKEGIQHQKPPSKSHPSDLTFQTKSNFLENIKICLWLLVLFVCGVPFF